MIIENGHIEVKRKKAQSFTAIKVHGYDNREWTYRGEAQKGRWH